MDISERLKTEPVGKLFFRLAFPSVLAQLVSLLYNIIDRIYLGHMEDIGSVALTGVGLCMPVICIINAFTMLIAMGGAPHASIAMGREDKNRAEKILGNCVVSLVGISVILTVLFCLWSGGPRCSNCNYFIAGIGNRYGTSFSDREKDLFENKEKAFPAGKGHHASSICSWACSIYHAGNGSRIKYFL